jgi:hypothetical protein
MRQTVPAAVITSVGHAIPDTPLQVSEGSQTPAEARQTVPAAINASDGQAAVLPCTCF